MTKDNQAAKTVIERIYRATLQEVWDLWTTKEGFESWWGPQDFCVKVHALEAREGGQLYYDMMAATPEMIENMKRGGHAPSHETRGHYAEYKPYERLKLVHMIDFLPGVQPYESTIVVDFIPAGELVRMVVTLYPMHNEEFSKMQVGGFTSQLTKLDQRFASA
jgi:uncharacterized protein YndB with AHSA1/START domain